MNNLYEKMRPAVEKIEFLDEIINDWSMNPEMPIQWSKNAAGKAYAGMERIIHESAEALRAIMEDKEVP